MPATAAPLEAAHRILRAAWPGAVPEPLMISENATFRVRGGPRAAVLRIYRPGYQSDAAIASELAWIAALRRDTDLDLIEPLVADGARAVLVDPVTGRRGVLFGELPGAPIADADLTREHFARLGAIAATLHSHTAGWPLPAGFERFTWDVGATIGDGARWGSWRRGPGVTAAHVAAIAPAAARVAARLAGFGTGPDRFGLTHGDLRAANLITGGGAAAGRAFTVIDFDDAGFTWHLFDFAAAVSFVETDPRLGEWADAWTDAYRRRRPLADEHLDLLPDLVIVRRLQLLGWLGTHPHVAEAGGSDFAGGTVALADRYLRRQLWRG